MKTLPIRLTPGQDLREALEAAVRDHVVADCRVRTTAEVLLGLLPEWVFSREVDATTGYAELVPRPRLS